MSVAYISRDSETDDDKGDTILYQYLQIQAANFFPV
jgi:hypothetical protein